MWMLYLIAAAPLATWAIMWAASKRIHAAEAIAASVIGVVCCLIFHAVAIAGMTDDVETWSGRVTEIRFDPPYTQWYMMRRTRTKYRTVLRTVGTGKNRRTISVRESYQETYYTRETRSVGPSWTANETLRGSHAISREQYERHVQLFGGEVVRRTGLKSNYDSGDPASYFAFPKSGYVWPSVDTRRWENRVKATPSLFSFAKVPDGAPVYEYPTNPLWYRSGRLLGSAGDTVDILSWDQMNGRLGPTKWVNVIAIGFRDQDKIVALQQQAKWVGGKQNDLVLCFGGPNEKPTWSFVFGWSEREIAKRNLETILLDHGFTPATLPLIEEEIEANYVIKDFSKFDYLTIEPPTWSIVTLTLITIGTQALLGLWFFKNEFNAESGQTVRRYRYGRF